MSLYDELEDIANEAYAKAKAKFAKKDKVISLMQKEIDTLNDLNLDLEKEKYTLRNRIAELEQEVKALRSSYMLIRPYLSDEENTAARIRETVNLIKGLKDV